MGSQEIAANDSLIPAYESLKDAEILPFFIQRIGQLPPTQRKILAMYYYEALSLDEIAAYFGLPEHQIEETRMEAVDLLHKYLLSLSRQNAEYGRPLNPYAQQKRCRWRGRHRRKPGSIQQDVKIGISGLRNGIYPRARLATWREIVVYPLSGMGSKRPADKCYRGFQLE